MNPDYAPELDPSQLEDETHPGHPMEQTPELFYNNDLYDNTASYGDVEESTALERRADNVYMAEMNLPGYSTMDTDHPAVAPQGQPDHQGMASGSDMGPDAAFGHDFSAQYSSFNPAQGQKGYTSSTTSDVANDPPFNRHEGFPRGAPAEYGFPTLRMPYQRQHFRGYGTPSEVSDGSVGTNPSRSGYPASHGSAQPYQRNYTPSNISGGQVASNHGSRQSRQGSRTAAAPPLKIHHYVPKELTQAPETSTGEKAPKVEKAPRKSAALPLEEQFFKLYTFLGERLVKGGHVVGASIPTEEDKNELPLLRNGKIRESNYTAVHNYLDNKFLAIGYQHARSETFLGGLGLNLASHGAVIGPVVRYLDTQSFAHILLSKLEETNNPIARHFDPQRDLQAKGDGWSIATGAREVFENELSTGTVLHFAHPILVEVAIQMLMVFPQAIIGKILNKQNGHRSLNMVVAPTVVLDAAFNNILDGVLEWHPSLDTDENKEIRARFSSTRALSTKQKVAEVTSKDEATTVLMITEAMFNGAEERITLTNRGRMVRAKGHKVDYPQGHIQEKGKRRQPGPFDDSA